MSEESIVPGIWSSRSQVVKRQGELAFTYDVWDNSVYGPKVVVDPDGTFRMFYTAYEAAYATWRICVATSADLVTWTKPIVGLFTFAGNTNNNIVLQVSDNLQFTDVFIDPITGLYVMTVRNDSTGTALIYWSADGVLFNFTSVPFTGTSGLLNGGAQAHSGLAVEIKSLSWSPQHNKYRCWYNDGQVANLRSIGYYDSATLQGTWVNRGYIPEFTSASATIQYYDFSPFYYAGSMWAVVSMYNSTTELLATQRLYRSEDHGTTWARSTDLMRRSVSGSWDFGLTSDGCPILVDGVWHFIYAGKTGDHASTVQIRFGIATAVQNPAIANVTAINWARL